MSLSKDQTTTIYWIRHKDHTDLMTQGYVGITTKTAEFRYRQHINFNLSKDIQSNFNRAIRLYHPKGELVLEELCVTTKEHALYLENKLRPDFMIGWNICQGGQIGLPYLNDKQITLGRQKSKANLKVKKGKDHHCYGTTQSDETRKKKSEALKKFYEDNPEKRLEVSLRQKGSKRTPEQIQAMSEYRQQLALTMSPWEYGTADKFMWLQAQLVYEIFQLLNYCGNYKLMNFLNVPIQKTKGLHKLFRKGWIPILDQKWLDFYEQNKKEGYESFEESAIL